jgi:hypothetical protein
MFDDSLSINSTENYSKDTLCFLFIWRCPRKGSRLLLRRQDEKATHPRNRIIFMTKLRIDNI